MMFRIYFKDTFSSGGEPLLNLPAVIKYPFYDEETDLQRFPFRNDESKNDLINNFFNFSSIRY